MNKPVKLAEKYYHYFFLAVLFVSALYINFHVTLQGDDYIYRQAAVCKLTQIFDFLKWHYADYNGRTLVHFLDILTLKFSVGEYIWKVVCSALLCAYCVVVSRLFSDRKSDEFKLGIVLAVFSIVSVHPCIWNESLYWITGSFNYFFPNLLFLALLLVYRNNPKSKLLLPITLICAFTVEQVCMMTLGFWVLMLSDKLISQKKIEISYLVRILVSVAGIVSIVFLSKSGRRMIDISDESGSFAVNFSGNVFNNIKTIWFGSVNVALLILVTLAVSGLWIIKLTNKKFVVIPAVVFAVFNYSLKAISMFTDIEFPDSFNIFCTVMLCCFAITYCATVLTAGILIYKYNKDWLPITVTILAFGAQLMLGVENYLIFRTCMPTIFMLSVYDIYSIINLKIKINFAKPLICVACLCLCIAHGYLAPNSLITQEKIDVKPLTDAQLEEFESYTEKYGSAFIYAKKDEFVEPEVKANHSWTKNELIDFSNY